MPRQKGVANKRAFVAEREEEEGRAETRTDLDQDFESSSDASSELSEAEVVAIDGDGSTFQWLDAPTCSSGDVALLRHTLSLKHKLSTLHKEDERYSLQLLREIPHARRPFSGKAGPVISARISHYSEEKLTPAQLFGIDNSSTTDAILVAAISGILGFSVEAVQPAAAAVDSFDDDFGGDPERKGCDVCVTMALISQAFASLLPLGDLQYPEPVRGRLDGLPVLLRSSELFPKPGLSRTEARSAVVVVPAIIPCAASLDAGHPSISESDIYAAAAPLPGEVGDADIPVSVSSALRPTLRKYQRRALHWMRDREQAAEDRMLLSTQSHKNHAHASMESAYARDVSDDDDENVMVNSSSSLAHMGLTNKRSGGSGSGVFYSWCDISLNAHRDVLSLTDGVAAIHSIRNMIPNSSRKLRFPLHPLW